MKRILVFDAASCTGCMSCVSTCAMQQRDVVSPASARIHIAFDPLRTRWPATFCRQCTRPACVEACPAGAIARHPAGDFIAIDYAACTGCQACIDACPLGAIFYDPAADEVIKCDTCQGAPACAGVCATGALSWGDAGDRRIYRRHKAAQP